METSLVTRILIGVASVAFLAVYLAWRWRRAGEALESHAAFGQEMSAYFAAMLGDPRWLRLRSMVQAHYRLDAPGSDPQAFEVHHVALVDDRGQIYGQHTSPGPTRVVALLARAQPSAQVFVSMDLASGTVREDPAPYGWTYQGPPR